MSEQKLVASCNAIKVLAEGQIEFKKGRPLKRSEIERLGIKYAECIEMGLLVSPDELREIERRKQMVESAS